MAADFIVLRAYRPDDEPALRAAFADPEIRRWNPPPADLDVTAWWQRRNDRGAGDHLTWAVASGLDDRLLGDVSVHDVDLASGDAEIGYTVLPGERGRGVARRAITMAVTRVFADTDLFRIRLLHAVGNGASCNAALAAGFVLEGTLRQSYVYGDGLRHDEHLHARLRTDPRATRR